MKKLILLALLLGGCASGPSTHDRLMETIRNLKEPPSPWVSEFLREGPGPGKSGIIQPMPSPGGGYIVY
jgi:hypothetical protein